MAAGPFTVGFGFKTDSDRFYHSRLLEPTQKTPFIVVFKLKSTVMCRCYSHANNAPTNHNSRKTAPTYPDNFSSETKLYHECLPL